MVDKMKLWISPSIFTFLNFSLCLQ